MTEPTGPTGPELRLVLPTDDDVDAPTSTEGSTTEESPAEEARDPLLARAERIAELPLRERPGAFDGLNRAVVAELNTLEEG